jgi:hypothetical protein
VSGKKGIAPCGHPGTYVFNQFVACDLRCEFPKTSKAFSKITPSTSVSRNTKGWLFEQEDAIDEFADETTPGWTAFPDLTICPKCASLDTEPFRVGTSDLEHCITCGHVWQA